VTGYAVIDAGVAVRAVVDSPQRLACWALFEDLAERGVRTVAPDLWLYEVTSVFCKMLHFGLLDRPAAEAALADSQELGIELIAPDSELRDGAFRWTRRLRRAAAYDSFYLALAERVEGELWTTDEKLVRAADVPWLRSVG
jgi:predicted nucleic acid-binding protein